MRVAIVGSRKISHLGRHMVRNYCRELQTEFGEGLVIVTGGAIGVDQEAMAECKKLGIECLVIRPDYDEHGKRAPLVRNVEIASKSGLLVAFWDGKSTGTRHVLAEAKKKGVFTRIFPI